LKDGWAACRLPVGVWRELMAHPYPNAAWLCLRRDVFGRLRRFQAALALPTCEQAIEKLLPTGGE
jgi:hypothetical protein